MAIEGTAEMERSTDAALSAFVTEHYDRLLRLARLVCRDASDSADAVQVGLEQAWRRRSTLRDDAPILSGCPVGSSSFAVSTAN